MYKVIGRNNNNVFIQKYKQVNNKLVKQGALLTVTTSVNMYNNMYYTVQFLTSARKHVVNVTLVNI